MHNMWCIRLILPTHQGPLSTMPFVPTSHSNHCVRSTVACNLFGCIRLNKTCSVTGVICVGRMCVAATWASLVKLARASEAATEAVGIVGIVAAVIPLTPATVSIIITMAAVKMTMCCPCLGIGSIVIVRQGDCLVMKCAKRPETVVADIALRTAGNKRTCTIVRLMTST